MAYRRSYEGTSCPAKTSAVSCPPCALVPLQQPFTSRRPTGVTSSSCQRNCLGEAGRGQKQKDTEIISLAIWVLVGFLFWYFFSIFRIQNPCVHVGGGMPRRQGKKSFHVSGTLHKMLLNLQYSAPECGAWVFTQRGLYSKRLVGCFPEGIPGSPF